MSIHPLSAAQITQSITILVVVFVSILLPPDFFFDFCPRIARYRGVSILVLVDAALRLCSGIASNPLTVSYTHLTLPTILRV